jgi:poly(3-hydroxybutyrate) depolymerase
MSARYCRLIPWLVAAMSLPLAAAAHDLTPFQEVGRGHVLHEDVSPSGTETINIETYVPRACAGRPCPLVFSLHGLQRNAESARDNWVEAAERYGLLIAAPHFDKERFPTRLYQQGGVGSEPDPARWVYAVIERFFDRALKTGRVAGETYTLFGHSAGAQFVHRMAILMPQARFSTAVSANAGYYTLPVGKQAAGGFGYPYSLDGTPATQASLTIAFGKPLLVMLGEQDTDPDHPQLNKSKGAQAQGPDRLARGRNFVAVATAEATRLGSPIHWREIVVPGAAHEQRKMANAAADVLFGGK